MLFVHRANTLSDFYRHYYLLQQRAFEIDVQKTADGIIVVYHDDVSKVLKADLHYEVPTFECFLSYIPNDIHLNVEIKNYNNTPIIVEDILLLCRKYFKNKFSFSSFHQGTYEVLLKHVDDTWRLYDKVDTYNIHHDNVCVNKKLLHIVQFDAHKAVYVYNVNDDEVLILEKEYPSVSGWITDFKTI